MASPEIFMGPEIISVIFTIFAGNLAKNGKKNKSKIRAVADRPPSHGWSQDCAL